MARRQGGTLGTFTPLSTPNAPTGLSVSTSIGSASVSFTAPTDTGDGAVTSYIVTAIDESTGASSGATGSASPITVSPPAGGTFKIRAQAVNGFGPGRLTEFDTGHLIYAGAELYVWGQNDSGQVGDDSALDRSSPVQVGALTTWASVAGGSGFGGSDTSLAAKTDGTLWTWGAASFGRLGNNNTTVAKSSPVQIGALTNWQQVTGGSYHNAALKTDGTIWAWGLNSNGQLGQNDTDARSSPTQTGALTNWAQIAAGYSTNVAVKTDGTLWAWGRNSSGQAGNNSALNVSSPVQIGSLTTWSQVAGGWRAFNAAIKTDGTLWTWGANPNGQLGDGTVVYKSSPVQVGSLTNWAQVSCGSGHVAAITTGGALYAWGLNNNGRLGDGTTVAKSSPVQIGALTNWLQTANGYYSGNALKTDGTLWTWGRNNEGQLGDNTLVDRSSPIQIGALTTWLKVGYNPGGKHVIATLGVV
jgi:alpha-tubulin suppressor-like RCC1 family protein